MSCLTCGAEGASHTPLRHYRVLLIEQVTCDSYPIIVTTWLIDQSDIAYIVIIHGWDDTTEIDFVPQQECRGGYMRQLIDSAENVLLSV